MAEQRNFSMSFCAKINAKTAIDLFKNLATGEMNLEETKPELSVGTAVNARVYCEKEDCMVNISTQTITEPFLPITGRWCVFVEGCREMVDVSEITVKTK